ncbi:hypothetical protein C0993_009647, partial [Termitomyces sp. T159_Od127]
SKKSNAEEEAEAEENKKRKSKKEKGEETQKPKVKKKKKRETQDETQDMMPMPMLWHIHARGLTNSFKAGSATPKREKGLGTKKWSILGLGLPSTIGRSMSMGMGRLHSGSSASACDSTAKFSGFISGEHAVVLTTVTQILILISCRFHTHTNTYNRGMIA